MWGDFVKGISALGEVPTAVKKAASELPGAVKKASRELPGGMRQAAKELPKGVKQFVKEGYVDPLKEDLATLGDGKFTKEDVFVVGGLILDAVSLGRSRVIQNLHKSVDKAKRNLVKNSDNGKSNVSKTGEVGNKGTGKITGSLNGLTDAEKKVVNDLTASGKNVEVIPKDPNAKVKTPDFKVDGVKTELKTLENPNVNTGITRIQKGLKQGAETVIIDARDAGLTANQAKEIINRASGTYPNKSIPGKVEIWTNEGTITYP
ncbi:hypothetical protein AAFJ72_17470 [Brevibacillus gelatini]|uniref:CdiA C-terminal domain-containing protein n=1 Tax=Brevibacillus gelatini TaxID=1655277 RepID=UPI003D81727D